MKSPLKAKPLRNPGESVERQLLDVLLDEGFFYFVIALLLSTLAVIDWWRWYFEVPPMPWVSTLFAALAILFAVVKIRGALRKAKRLKLGMEGEKAVGLYLERLRESGAQVFHDISGEGFNLDHVIIHTSGIYVIETKTYSKPERGEAKIVYNGESLSKLGGKPDNKPIVQVRAASRWLAELLNETTGRKFAVRPVVLFPGWFIQPTADAKASDVWVLNPKALPAFITNSRQQLSAEDVKLCAYHLSRVIRAR